MRWYEVYSAGLVKGQESYVCENNHEHLCFIKCGKFFEHLRNR